MSTTAIEGDVPVLSRIARSAAVLAAGTFVGQLFVIALSPWLTRLYGPADLGLLGTYSATLYMLASVATLRYEAAIALARDQGDADRLSVVSMAILLGISLATLSSLLALGDRLPQGMHPIFVWALPLGVTLLGTYNISLNRRLRSARHALIARTRVLQAVSGATAQVGFGSLGMGPAGLVYGQLLGLIAGLFRLKDLPIRQTLREFDRKSVLALLKAHRNFPIFDAPATVASIANTHAPTIAIAMLFSPASAGQYALVQRVLVTPFSMVSGALSSSLFSHARTFGSQDARAYTRRMLSLAALLSPIATLGACVANASFHLIFGSQWAGVGPVAAWVSLFLAQKFIFDSIFSTLAVSQRQRIGFLLQSGVMVVRLLALVLAASVLDFDRTLIVFSIATSLCYHIASHAAFDAQAPDRHLAWLAGALDWIFPFAVVHCVLNGTAVTTACIVYGVWVSWRGLALAASWRKPHESVHQTEAAR